MKKRFLFFGNFVLLVSMFFLASLANAQGFTTLGVGISTPTGTFHVHNANSTDGNEGIRQLSLNPVSYEATMHLTNAATGTAKTDGLLVENGYKLNSLEETERYINDNGHLPGVPSASEVETDGVNLGEMNKILLQKIEELTLQVIELNKQINELKGE